MDRPFPTPLPAARRMRSEHPAAAAPRARIAG